jgi:hypothetical protein
LFQSDNDVDRLASLLNEDFISDTSKAVGILAVRSVFSGPMEDLPGHLPKGAADSLPFYILAMGSVGDVSWCLREIRERSGLNSAASDRQIGLLFSRTQVLHLNQKLDSFPANLVKPGYTTEPGRVLGASDRGIPYFVSKHDFSIAPRNFPHVDLLIPGPQVGVPAAGQEDLVRINAFSTGRKELKEAAQAATADLRGKSQLAIRTSRLNRNATYLFQLELLAAKTDFADLHPWDLEFGETARIVRTGAFDAGPDGRRAGKTPNLRHFLRTLSSRMFQKDIPLARYCFFVETR